MNALSFTPNTSTISMDPVPLDESGERESMWMVRTEDGMVGPVSLSLVVRGVNLGRVPADAEVSPAASNDWRPVSEMLRDNEPKCQRLPDVPVRASFVVPVEEPKAVSAEVEWPASFAPQSHHEIQVPPAPITLFQQPPSVSTPPQPVDTLAGDTIVDVDPKDVWGDAMPPAPPRAISTRPVVPPPMIPQRPAAAVVPQPIPSVPFAPPSIPSQPTAISFDESVSIPKESSSATLIAFAATLAASAFVAAGIAILQAL